MYGITLLVHVFIPRSDRWLTSVTVFNSEGYDFPGLISQDKMIIYSVYVVILLSLFYLEKLNPEKSHPLELKTVTEVSHLTLIAMNS